MTLDQVLLDNRWTSADFEKSTDVNKFMNTGIVTEAGPDASAMLNAMNEANVQSVLTVGLVDSEWEEQNFGDTSDTDPGAIKPFFDEVNVKTFYGNKWWEARNIQNDLMNTTKPYELIKNKVGGYWAIQWNRIISATVSGMADITDITVGDGTENLSALMVINARKKKGDMGVGKLADMYMSSTTLFDILTKQADGTITKELITEKYGQVTLVKDDITQLVKSDTPEYVYNGTTKIHVDDTITDGIISMVNKGAFAFRQKTIKKPLMYKNDPKAGNGSGLEEWGTKTLYICHPIGFSFKGVLGTTYSKKTGLSLAELQGGGLYELKVDPKLAPIQNLKVKIGA